jgi:hypothetical protein
LPGRTSAPAFEFVENLLLPMSRGFTPPTPTLANSSMNVKEDELPKVDDKLNELLVYTIKFFRSMNRIGNYFRA